MPLPLTRTDTETDPWQITKYIQLKKWMLSHGASKQELFECNGLLGMQDLLPKYGFPRPEGGPVRESEPDPETEPTPPSSPIRASQVIVDRSRSDNVEDFKAHLAAKAEHIKALEHDNKLLVAKEAEALVTSTVGPLVNAVPTPCLDR